MIVLAASGKQVKQTTVGKKANEVISLKAQRSEG